MILGAPQDRGVEGAFVQIVEGGVGGGGGDHLDARSGQGVGQGQEAAISHPGGQNAQGAVVTGAGVQRHAARGEGGDPQAELFLGDGGAAQLLQPKRRLGRMGRNGHGHVGAADAVGPGSDHQNGQPTRFGGGAQAKGDVFVQALDVDDGRLQREVLQRHLA